MGEAFRLKNGANYIVAEAPGGVYSSEQLRKIADLSENYSVVTKLTEDQRFGITVKDEEYDKVIEDLNEVGINVRNYQDKIHQPLCCIGDSCKFSKQDALNTSFKLSKHLSSIDSEQTLKIGINGCQRNCVPTQTLDISITGEDNGYKLYVGGKSSQYPELCQLLAEGIPESELPELVSKIIALHKEHATDKDDLIFDVIESIGIRPFIKILHPYSADANPDTSDQEDLENASNNYSEIDSLNPDVETEVQSDNISQTPEAERSAEMKLKGVNYNEQENLLRVEFDNNLTVKIDTKKIETETREINIESSILTITSSNTEIGVNCEEINILIPKKNQ